MYKYINLFSIAIFLTSTYILYANWTSKKNKKNTMMLMILITIIVYQISIIIKGFDTNLLQYNIKILVMLLILKLNLYKLKDHNLKFVMNTNYILSLFGIDAIKQSIPAKILIIIVVSWRWTGYNMILFLAAMQNIPEDYYEAATIDGANSCKNLYI